MSWSFSYNLEKNQFWLLPEKNIDKTICNKFIPMTKEQFIFLFENMRDAYRELKPRKPQDKYQRLRRIKVK